MSHGSHDDPPRRAPPWAFAISRACYSDAKRPDGPGSAPRPQAPGSGNTPATPRPRPTGHPRRKHGPGGLHLARGPMGPCYFRHTEPGLDHLSGGSLGERLSRLSTPCRFVIPRLPFSKKKDALLPSFKKGVASREMEGFSVPEKRPAREGQGEPFSAQRLGDTPFLNPEEASCGRQSPRPRLPGVRNSPASSRIWWNAALPFRGQASPLDVRRLRQKSPKQQRRVDQQTEAGEGRERKVQRAPPWGFPADPFPCNWRPPPLGAGCQPRHGVGISHSISAPADVTPRPSPAARGRDERGQHGVIPPPKIALRCVMNAAQRGRSPPRPPRLAAAPKRIKPTLPRSAASRPGDNRVMLCHSLTVLP